MIRHMAMGCILTLMGPLIKDIGRMISRAEKGSKNGRMGRNMKEITKMGLKMDLENSYGQTGLATKENLRIITLTEGGFTNGEIKENM